MVNFQPRTPRKIPTCATGQDVLTYVQHLNVLYSDFEIRFENALTISSLAEIVEVEIEVVSPSIVPSGVSRSLNRTVTCMVLKANDRRTSCPCHDEFRGPRSDYVRQVALATTQQQQKEDCPP
ncbi:secernin-1 [Trichonephila clavipes]|nr:secernin-1 [Trichonephila clavipes]